MLFTGDMEEPAETEVLKWNYPIACQILKVGHHGSHTATGAPFLAAVQPRVALISCGLHNKFRHPHPSTLKKLVAASVCVLRTDRAGTIKVETNGTTFTLHKEKACDI